MTKTSISLLAIIAAGTLLASRSTSQTRVASATLSGVVSGTYFVPPTPGSRSTTIASNYEGVKVCVDSNNDGVCGFGELNALTGKNGAFSIAGAVPGPIVAEIA